LLSNVYNQNAYFNGNGVRTSLVAAVLRAFSRQRIKPNCPIKCSLSGPQRILLRGWLTELTDSEGSDNERRDSEESDNEITDSEGDAGQKRSRTVKSEVVNL
jgi:hypothetical protein